MFGSNGDNNEFLPLLVIIGCSLFGLAKVFLHVAENVNLALI